MSNEPKVVKVQGPVETEMVPAPAEIPNNEIEAQIAAALRRPRKVSKFLADAKEMATLTEEIAESCLYRLKRWDPEKQMEVPLIGGSIRLAEICLSAWGNCHAGARPVEEGQRYVKAQGVCWDVERNVRVTMETTRGITKRNGERYKPDMIVTTMNAAAAIALRNAIFKVVPVALVDEVLEAAKKASVGEVASKRAKVIQRLAKYGATVERVLASLGRKAIEEITVEDLEILMASGQTLKAGEQTVDELFPPLTPAAQAQPGPAPAAAGSTPAQAQPGSSDGGAPAPAPRETPAASPPAATVTPISSAKPKQETLASVAGRGRASRGAPPAARNVDDVIGGPPPKEPSYEEQEAANRKAAEPSPDELPPWAGGGK